MSRIIIMQGLPASGKSTKAKEIIQEVGNAVRVNRDLLRKMLHFDKWNGHNEAITTLVQRTIVNELLANTQKSVIIDDTNLNPKVLNFWVEYAKTRNLSYEIVAMTTPIEECIHRDWLRQDGVGRDVIINMARKFGLYKWELKDVIVDMDGTLADITHRLHHVQKEPKDWRSFFLAIEWDTLRQDVYEKIMTLSKDNNIVIVSARPEKYREVTKDWLAENGVPYQTLIMRGDGDRRDDAQVKLDILNTYFRRDMIECVFDDRPRVIRMWKENGLKVEDVGEGIEF